MSHSTLWACYRTKVVRLAEYRNGHGSAPPIWDLLWSTYVEQGMKLPLMREERLRELWALGTDPKVAEHHRLALQFTFDRCVVPSSLWQTMATALRTCHSEIVGRPLRWAPLYIGAKESEPTAWEWSHLPAIARHLETLADPSLIPVCDSDCTGCDKSRARRYFVQVVRPRAIGVGLGCTSVSDPFEEVKRPVDECFLASLGPTLKRGVA
jgi:hypothetical protein